jgi:hypothetical protein
VNNAEILASKYKLGSIVRIKDLGFGVPKETPKDPFSFLTSFVKHWEEGLDFGKQVFDDYSVTVTCNAFHATVLRD